MPARLALFLLLLSLLGCDEPTLLEPATLQPIPLGATFDEEDCGTIRGEVTWAGLLPRVAPFRSIPNPLTDQPPPPARDWPNPNAPRIDPVTHAVASVVVFLRGIDPRRSRPWDHSPVRIELDRQAFQIEADDRQGHIGLVRAGTRVELVSRDDLFHLVQFRGATFLSRPLPRRNDTALVPLDKPGLVELRSGCGYFWMRAYLHVCEHPYYTLTDERGRFRLEEVPSGEYELVIWHPNWHVLHYEHNPDNFRVQQVTFGSPLQTIRRITVQAGQTTSVSMQLSASNLP
jgi:hypothetical protein